MSIFFVYRHAFDYIDPCIRCTTNWPVEAVLLNNNAERCLQIGSCTRTGYIMFILSLSTGYEIEMILIGCLKRSGKWNYIRQLSLKILACDLVPKQSRSPSWWHHSKFQIKHIKEALESSKNWQDRPERDGTYGAYRNLHNPCKVVHIPAPNRNIIYRKISIWSSMEDPRKSVYNTSKQYSCRGT